MLLTGACSSGDNSSADSARFADSYREVTDEYRTATEEIQEQAGVAAQTEGLDAVVGLYEDLLEATEAAHEEFEDLNPPEDFEEPVASMAESLEAQAEVLQELVDGSENENIGAVTAAAQELTDLQQQWNEARLEVDSLLEECGEDCE